VPNPPGRVARAVTVGAVGVVIILGIWLVWRDNSVAANSDARREAALAFLDAWAISRETTWKMIATFERTPANGSGKLSSPLEMVQRPPDRLVRQFGSVAGLLDGEEVGCSTGPDGETQCRSGAPKDYEEEVATELSRLESYVAGPVPIYAVTREGSDCFRLDRQLEYLLPPYGDQATFCFDGSTGAPVRTEVVRPEATDVTKADAVSADVTDADFELPAPLES
jgi:hypothetical protein